MAAVASMQFGVHYVCTRQTPGFEPGQNVRCVFGYAEAMHVPAIPKGRAGARLTVLAPEVFARRVFRQLSLAAIVAGAFAWLSTMSTSVSDLVFDVDANGALRLSSWGALVAVAPLPLWGLANLLMDRPRPVAGAVCFWTLSIGLGLAANILLCLLTDASGPSVFYISAFAFAALGVDARSAQRTPRPRRVFVIFALAALAMACLFDVILTQSAYYFFLDLAGGLAMGLLAARAVRRFPEVLSYFAVSFKLAAIADLAAVSIFLVRFAQAPHTTRS